MARNVTMVDRRFLTPGQYLMHERDGKFCPAFQQAIHAAGMTWVSLPAQSPNLKAYAGRVGQVHQGGVSRTADLVRKTRLRHALSEFEAHYHQGRPHQSKGHVMLMPPLPEGTAWQPHEGVTEQRNVRESYGCGLPYSAAW